MAQELNLFVDADQGRLVLAFNSTFPATLPSFKFGDSVPTSVRVLTANGNDSTQPFKESDLTNRAIRLAIGVPAGKPISGTFKLSFSSVATAAIAYNASAADVQAALNAVSTITAAGGVVVTSPTTGVFRIVFNNAGARTAITADTAPLYPSTSAFIDESAAGDVSTREVVLIRLEVQPAAYVQLDDELPDAAIAIIVTREGSAGVGAIQIIDLSNPEPYGGDYALTISGHATAAISHNALPEEVQSIIQAAHASFVDKVTVTGAFPRYTVSFAASLAAVPQMGVNFAGLIVPRGRKGTLNLNTTGITELLGGASSASAKLEIEIRNTLDSTSYTPIQQDVTVVEDVIPSNPASQTPAPTYVQSDDLPGILDEMAVRHDAAQAIDSAGQAQARDNISAAGKRVEFAIVETLTAANHSGKWLILQSGETPQLNPDEESGFSEGDIITFTNAGDPVYLLQNGVTMIAPDSADFLMETGRTYQVVHTPAANTWIFVG